MSDKICTLSAEDILKEIYEQIENMEYLKKHPNIAQSTILRETPEYIRGAINLLNYMKEFIENHCVETNKVPLTPEEFKNKMEELSKISKDVDTEHSHREQDYLMCDLLINLGYRDGIKIFLNSKRWYA